LLKVGHAGHTTRTYGLATAHRTKAAAEASGITFLAEMNVTSIAELRNVSMDDLLVYDNSGTPFWRYCLEIAPPSRSHHLAPVIDATFTILYGESLRLNAHGDIPILTETTRAKPLMTQ